MKLAYIYIFILILLHCWCSLGCGVPLIKYESNYAREMRPGEFPWQVQLQLNWRYLCGGVILDRWWVLTTAHCIFMFSEELYESLVIIAGTLEVEDVQIIYNVHKVILHEFFMFDLFGNTISDNDVALIMVREPFLFNNLVSPICLPDDRHLDLDTVLNCWVTGWQLKSLDHIPPIYQMAKQNVGHEKLATCEKFYPENLRKNVICVTNWNKKQSLCMGGYGPPLECQDMRSKIWIVIGAATFCKRSCNYTALFTRYSYYINWIKRSTILAGRPFLPFGLPPKPTVPCHRIRHVNERSFRQKPVRQWERRWKWKQRQPYEVVYTSSSSNALWRPWRDRGLAACLVQLALLLKGLN